MGLKMTSTPDGHARAMLQGQGIDDPGLASTRHLSSAISSRYDPITIALALAQASHAEEHSHSLGHHDRLHLLHHAAAQRGHFAHGGVVGSAPGTMMHPAVAAAFAAMGRRHYDDGGGRPASNSNASLGSTPDPDPAPYTGATGSTPLDRGIAAIPAYVGHVAQGVGDAITLPRDVMQGTVDPTSDEGIARAASLAAMLPAGGMPMAEAGALGSAGGAMTVDKLKALWDFDVDALPPPETPPASAAELRHRVDSLNPNGLPVDEASRLGRARDLGFDTSTPLYHGTTSSWEGTGFRETDGRTRERATFLTPDPQVANAYARSPYARAFDSTEGNILPVYARMRNPKVIDMEGSGYADTSVHDAIEDARSAGHDGVVFHNMIDMSGPNLDQVPQTQVAVFHPRNIRSVFGTFDPAMEGSTDLMSAGGISALPSSSANDQLPYGQPPVVGPDGVTRGAFANGGSIPQFSGLPLHPAVAAALAAMQRPHFDDGGGEGGDSEGGSRSSSGVARAEIAATDTARRATTRPRRLVRLACGGFGGGSSDGYGGGSSSSSSVRSGGGHSDASTGGADTSSAGGNSNGSSGGQSDASTGGGSAGGVGGAVGGQSDASTGGGGVMGGAGLSGGAAMAALRAVLSARLAGRKERLLRAGSLRRARRPQVGSATSAQRRPPTRTRPVFQAEHRPRRLCPARPPASRWPTRRRIPKAMLARTGQDLSVA